MMFTYPNVDIIGDLLFIHYARMWPKEERETEMMGEGVMRIYPLDWFYR